MKSFRSLPLPIIAVLIWTDVTSAQEIQTNNATRMLRDQINNLMKGSRTPEQLRCIVCADLHGQTDKCRDVTEVGRCISNGGAPISGKRKKRQAGRHWIPSAWRNYPSFTHFQTLSPISDQGGPVICPQQMPQSYFYDLNMEPTGYPVDDIAIELSTNAVTGCLLQQLVFPDTFPPLFYDSFIQNSTYTCPYTEHRLWSYYSPGANSRCWVLQTFQENILYKICRSRFCQNCNVPPRRPWPWRIFPNRQVGYNLCTTEYKQVSLWAYCPQLNVNERIVWDRIIIPVGCICQSVLCSPS